MVVVASTYDSDNSTEIPRGRFCQTSAPGFARSDDPIVRVRPGVSRVIKSDG